MKIENYEIEQCGIKDLSEKLLSILCHQKELFFFLCIYEMVQISKKEYQKYEVETIDKGRDFWVDRNNLEVESDVVNWVQIFDQFDQKKKKKTTDMS